MAIASSVPSASPAWHAATSAALRNGGAIFAFVLKPSVASSVSVRWCGETSAVMAIDPALVDLDAANAELPPFPEVTNQAPVHTAFFFFFSSPGSVHRASQSGTWGDAREASAEYGERYLSVVTDATTRLLDDIERTFAAMPPR